VKGVDRPAGGSIQNGLSRSLISQEFLPKGDPNRRFRHTLRNKCFFGASDPTADQRAGGTFIFEEENRGDVLAPATGSLGQSRSRVCQPEKHTLVLSLTAFEPKRFPYRP